MTTKSKMKLDPEEKEILDSFEKGEWKSVQNIEKEKRSASEAGSRFMRKDARINIRISSNDLDQIKRIAAYEGLSYQTLIASVLHKFAASQRLAAP